MQISLTRLGTHTSVIKHENRGIEVPTVELQFSSNVPEDKRIAYILAPRTGRCYLRTKASAKGEIFDKCKAGTVAQVPIRNTASNDSASVMKLCSGTEVTVLAKSGNWYEVEYEGMHGYVHKNFLLLNE